MRRDKYKIGQKGASSTAFDLISGQYEQSDRGQMLKMAEKDRDVRAAIRERTIEYNNNTNYDVINGLPRKVINVPDHERYNNPNYQPPEALDMAGRPTRVNSNM